MKAYSQTIRQNTEQQHRTMAETLSKAVYTYRPACV